MKVPTCKLCGKAHWASEEHDIKESGVPDYVRDMAAGAMGVTKTVTKTRDEKNTTDTINVTPKQMEEDIKEGRTTLTRGRPKKHDSAAARQRAYRERSK